MMIEFPDRAAVLVVSACVYLNNVQSVLADWPALLAAAQADEAVRRFGAVDETASGKA